MGAWVFEGRLKLDWPNEVEMVETKSPFSPFRVRSSLLLNLASPTSRSNGSRTRHRRPTYPLQVRFFRCAHDKCAELCENLRTPGLPPKFKKLLVSVPAERH